MAETTTSSNSGGGLKAAFQDTMSALGDRATSSAQQRIGGLTDKLNQSGGGGGGAGKIATKVAEETSQGGSPVKGALKGAVSAGKDKITDALPGKKGGGNKRKPPAATKAMNLVESIDVGVPVKVAFNQWTQYDEWPSFMKKVEEGNMKDDNEAVVSTKLHVFWFRRTQESTIEDQIPDERIVWRSRGQKGHVDGCVTFHEIGPRLTRILVTLEYYPKGFVERIGNIWRAQGRRMRLELKHFRRHVMMSTILQPDEAEGWRGEVEDHEVIRSHDEVVEEEQRQEEESDQDESDQDRQGEDQDQEQGQEEGEEQQDLAEGEDSDEQDQDSDEQDQDSDEQAPEEDSDEADQSGDENAEEGSDEQGDESSDEYDEQDEEDSDEEESDDEDADVEETDEEESDEAQDEGSEQEQDDRRER